MLAAAYNARETQRQELDGAYRETLILARAMAALQADVMLRTRQLLYGLAAGFETKPEALFAQECGVVLRRVAEGGTVYANITVADAAGNIRCSLEPLGRPVNIADRGYFRQAMNEKSFAVSDVISGRVIGSSIIVAAQPVAEPYMPVSAMLLASIDVRRLAELFERAGPPAEVVATLVDGHGRVLARWPFAAEYLGKTFEGFLGVHEGNTPQDEGVARLIGLDGVPRVVAYSKLRELPGTPLYVVAGIPAERIEEQASHALWRNLAAMAVTLVLALGMGFAGGQRLIVGPLRRLTSAAQRYRRGDLAARSGLSREGGEIGALAGAFDELATTNQQVTRALRALSAGNRTLLREKDEQALLNAMCKVAVEEAGYRLAFVNYAEQDEAKSIHAVARAGYDEGFIDSLQVTWADTERGRASAGTAIRTGKTTIIRSVTRDPRFALWREEAVARGYGSVASFPLFVEGAIIGTFTIVAAEEDAFDESELVLLDEMAADLAFGVEVLRSDRRREQAEQRAWRATTHDSLTGLPGRIPFMRALEEAMGRNDAAGESLGVLVVYLPNLQDLHDSLGYDASRVVVGEAAQRLRSIVDAVHHLARLGSDEFTLLLPKADTPALEEVARRLASLSAAPVDVGAVPVTLRMAVGAVLFPRHGGEADVLLRRAAIASREASRRELPFYLYAGATERENPERLALASRLRGAIETGQLLLHFQPKVDLQSRAVRGFEALVRWKHPEKGMIPPMQFVPIAEHTGLIRPLTVSVIDMAVRELHGWRSRGIHHPIAVNLSPRNLHDPRLVAQITALLDTWDVPSASLEFEITESALADDPEAARAVLGQLRDLGCKLYIDDFGTGYSSLSYLVSLPVHALKIDRSFVRQMGRSNEARAVVSSIISLAAKLGLHTVAEGVESCEEAELLQQLGCAEAQGYFFGKPVSVDQLLA